MDTAKSTGPAIDTDGDDGADRPSETETRAEDETQQRLKRLLVVYYDSLNPMHEEKDSVEPAVFSLCRDLHRQVANILAERRVGRGCDTPLPAPVPEPLRRDGPIAVRPPRFVRASSVTAKEDGIKTGGEMHDAGKKKRGNRRRKKKNGSVLSSSSSLSGADGIQNGETSAPVQGVSTIL